jgi:hypothetical protein
MQLVDLMQEVEEYRFSAEVNLASGTRAFRRGLRGHELFQKLVRLAQDHPNAQAAIVARIATLSDMTIDQRYENRFDAALSAYLTVLGETAQADIIARAASTASTAPNCWWTIGISRELLMWAIATGEVHSEPVIYVDAGILAQAGPAKGPVAEKLWEWFAHRRTAMTLESASQVLQLFHRAQSTGYANSGVTASPQDRIVDQPLVLPRPRRRNRSRHRPGYRGATLQHKQKLAHAS